MNIFGAFGLQTNICIYTYTAKLPSGINNVRSSKRCLVLAAPVSWYAGSRRVLK